MSAVIAMSVFALTMSITPGPVNLTILSIGLERGALSAMRFVSGAGFGFALLLIASGLGLGSLLAAFPKVMVLLNFVGAGFIAYLGYKLAMSEGKPMSVKAYRHSFLAGFLLQWVNPKAWASSMSSIAAFQLDQLDKLLFFTALYFCICYTCLTCWAVAGGKLRSLFENSDKRTLFNKIMGAGLVFVAAYLAWQ